MAKITLSDILTVTNAPASINGNNDLIQDAFENTLSRDGTSPNEMLAPLDMNSQRIYNLPAPQSTTDPVRLGDLSSGAAGLAVADQTAAEAGLSGALLMSPLETKHAFRNGLFLAHNRTGAVARSLLTWYRESLSVFDFMTTAQIADVQAGTRTLDVTSAVQAAITATPAGWGLYVPPGRYRISSTLNINYAIKFYSDVCGNDNGPTSLVGAIFDWYGTGGTMCNWGGHGARLVAHGHMENIHWRGITGAENGVGTIAAYGVKVMDAIYPYWKSVHVTYCSAAAVWMTNSPDAEQVTGIGEFNDLQVQLIGGATNNAIGLLVQSNPGVSGALGVTLMHMNHPKINHVIGPGVLFSNASGYASTQCPGDNWLWTCPFIFRPQDATIGSAGGFGVQHNNADPNYASGSHTFIKPSVIGGFYFAGYGCHQGTKLIAANMSDMGTNLLLNGPGCQDVYCDTEFHTHYGAAVTVPSMNSSCINDSMRFIRYDSANSVLFTSQATWKVDGVGTPALYDGGTTGGAVQLQTSGANGDVTAIYDISALGSDRGWLDVRYSIARCVIYPNESANVKYRVGWMSDLTDTPTNGCYLELDPSVNSGYWQLVTRKAGTETRVNSAVLAGGSDKLGLDLFWQSGQFAARISLFGNKGKTNMGKSTTNVPIVPMPFVYLVKTKTAAAKNFYIESHKCGMVDEDSWY